MFLLCLGLLALLSACGAAPVGIYVSASPTAKTVPQGGEPDLTGGYVTVTYEDRSTKEVPMSDLEQRGLNTAELGEQTLVLVYTEKKKTFSTTLELTVTLPKAKTLELNTESVKKNYFVGENFDRTGLVVTANYETGASAEVTNYEITPSRLSANTTKVTVSYRSATAEIPVTVIERAVTSLTVTTMPTKTEYFVGESFSSEGLVATVLYNDDTTERFVASALTYAHASGEEYFSPSAPEDDLVKVTAQTSLGTVTGEFRLTVKAVLPLSMTATVTEGSLTFSEGDIFTFGSARNVSVLVRFNNGTSETFVASDDVFYYSHEPLVAGQTKVTITYGDYAAVTAEVPVTVEAITVSSVSVLVTPVKTIYSAGESVDLEGLILLLEMSDFSRETAIYEAGGGFACSPAVVTESTRLITVTYQGFEASFEIEVE